MRLKVSLFFAMLCWGTCCPAQSALAACVMTSEEKSWIDGSLAASEYVRRQKLHLASDDHPTIVLFDERCRFEAKASPSPEWKGTPHEGKIMLPDGTDVPVAITSFTGRDDKIDLLRLSAGKAAPRA